MWLGAEASIAPPQPKIWRPRPTSSAWKVLEMGNRQRPSDTTDLANARARSSELIWETASQSGAEGPGAARYLIRTEAHHFPSRNALGQNAYAPSDVSSLSAARGTPRPIACGFPASVYNSFVAKKLPWATSRCRCGAMARVGNSSRQAAGISAAEFRCCRESTRGLTWDVGFATFGMRFRPWPTACGSRCAIG